MGDTLPQHMTDDERSRNSSQVKKRKRRSGNVMEREDYSNIQQQKEPPRYANATNMDTTTHGVLELCEKNDDSSQSAPDDEADEGKAVNDDNVHDSSSLPNLEDRTTTLSVLQPVCSTRSLGSDNRESDSVTSGNLPPPNTKQERIVKKRDRDELNDSETSSHADDISSQSSMSSTGSSSLKDRSVSHHSVSSPSLKHERYIVKRERDEYDDEVSHHSIPSPSLKHERHIVKRERDEYDDEVSHHSIPSPSLKHERHIVKRERDEYDDEVSHHSIPSPSLKHERHIVKRERDEYDDDTSLNVDILSSQSCMSSEGSC